MLGFKNKVADLSKRDDPALADDEAFVQELVETVAEAGRAVKDAKQDEDTVRAAARRVISGRFDLSKSGEGSPSCVTMYSFRSGEKLSYSRSGGGQAIDPEKLLEGLYERFGEQPGDTKGRAWKAWLACTAPVRVLDQAKLEELVKKDELVREAAVSATSETAPVWKLSSRAMSKADVKAYESGELRDFVVVS